MNLKLYLIYNWNQNFKKLNLNIELEIFIKQEHEVGEKWKGGSFYKRLLKLINSLQHKTTNTFLTIIFIFGL